ncbi:thiol reductant ABC exporter subunit CydD [Halomonas denitrificans]|nr:thiol reductant ABC exporter subunit CydD [Halomonas denitrificans]
MPAVTDRSTGAWLGRQAPGWLRPAMAGLAVIEAGLILAQAGAIAALVRQVVVESRTPAMALAAGLLAALLLRAVVLGARSALASGASAGIRVDLRRRMLDALRNAGPAVAPPTGRVLAAFDDQIEKLDAYYARFLPQQFAAAIVPAMVLAVVFVVDWVAGAFLLLSAPLIPLFMVLVGWGAEARARAQVDALGRLGGWFLDRLRGAATLKRFGAEGETDGQVLERTDALRRASMRVLQLAFLSSAVLEFFASVAIAAVAIYVGMGLLGFLSFGPAADLTLAGGLFVLLLAPEFFAPLRAMAQGWHDRADARAAVAEVATVLGPADPGAEPASRAGRQAASGSSDGPGVSRTGSAASAPAGACSVVTAAPVRIRGLCFAYPDRPVLFDGLDLAFERGERVVLSGPSGGGKSTLIDLLAGFLHPAAGRIEIGGEDAAPWSETERAARVAWLGQRPTLFPGTLYENIALGWAEATTEEVEAIAESAGVMDFAHRLDRGLDSAVGERGERLSGGQIQRVALARALLRPRPVLLLDEPTAHLDRRGERRVLDALSSLLESRDVTVVAASHRPEMIERADRVVRIDAGRVAELSVR